MVYLYEQHFPPGPPIDDSQSDDSSIAASPIVTHEDRVDELIAYLLQTVPEHQVSVSTNHKESAGVLASAALSNALALANGGVYAPRSWAGPCPPQPLQKASPPETPPVRAQRVAHGSAGHAHEDSVATRLPPLRGGALSRRLELEALRMPVSSHTHRVHMHRNGPAPVEFGHAKAQLFDRAVRQCNPRFDVWADVELAPSPRQRLGAPPGWPSSMRSPRAFYASGLHNRCKVAAAAPLSPRRLQALQSMPVGDGTG